MSIRTRRRDSSTGRTLQVIVKLGDIVLTPDKSRCPDGSWHVEGMLKERDTSRAVTLFATLDVRMTSGALINRS
ncbi:hypothetical protein OH76DRAFT_1479346 [Lentinus brumalis]|uniref:DUF4246 domain-containing protein n=1 Tax=Lentinus brumalis TaxID=2498619 RepID=A0A371DP86_9APHY|nr:hypothetical protein OH76DRAFT_1479346 [Polyporus brumalis]